MVLHRYVLALEVADFVEALAERSSKGRIGRSGIDESDDRRAACSKPPKLLSAAAARCVASTAIGVHERVAATDIKCVGAALERVEGGRDILRPADFEGGDFEAEGARHCLNLVYIGGLERQAGNVAARPGQARDHARDNWVSRYRKDDRDDSSLAWLRALRLPL